MRHCRYRHQFRAYRRREGRVILGVCGGIADHFELPAWIVRLTFIILTLVMSSAFVALYLLLALLMKPAPREPFRDFAEEEFFNSYQTSRADTLEKIERSFSSLDKRLQTLESVVTRPSFQYEDDFRKL